MSGVLGSQEVAAWPRRVVVAVLALLVLSTAFLLTSPVDDDQVLAAVSGRLSTAGQPR